MLLRRPTFALCLLLFSFNLCNAQIEVAHVSVKDFSATGFGAFLNFSLPVSEANYITLEGGLQYFVNQYEEEVGLIPVLIGYRYTLNQTGKGLYVEPNVGYTFGSSTIGIYTENGSPIGDGDGWAYEKVAGPTAGMGVGYLFEIARVPFNLGLRYEHSFASAATNVFSCRISYSFSFGRKSDD